MSTKVGTSRVTRRARAILNKLVANHSITPTGMDWLIAATDPFHDTQLEVRGYPDLATSRSLMQCVTKTSTFRTPLSTDDNWDLHVFAAPMTYSMSTRADGTIDSGYYPGSILKSGNVNPQLPVPVVQPIYGGVNVISTTEGGNWGTDVLRVSSNAVAFPVEFSTDSYRLIAWGYEVVNVTSQLYKGGSVTCYKSPSRVIDVSVIGQQSPLPEILLCKGVQAPPQNQPDAAIFPDSRTWGAADGVYQVCTLNDIENPYYSPMPGAALMYDAPDDPQIPGWSTPVWAPYFGPDSATTRMRHACSTSLPWDVSGCVFTGLAAQSAMTVTVKYFYERVPTPSDQALQVLTHPAPPFDELALRIYSQCMAELPIAVPVGENPLGEWFADVLDAISKFAPIVGGALSAAGVPFAGAIGTGLGIAAGAGSAAIRSTTTTTTTNNSSNNSNPVRTVVTRQTQVPLSRNARRRQRVRLVAAELGRARLPRQVPFVPRRQVLVQRINRRVRRNRGGGRMPMDLTE